MISRERTFELSDEVERIKAKYNPQTIEDLERVAIDEYGVVEVIRTFIKKPEVIRERGSGNLFIFYHARSEAYLPIVLGHEIGHVAANHLKTPSRILDNTQRQLQELEADYFSALLNDVCLRLVAEYRFNDSLLGLFEKVRNLFQREKLRQERTRLQQLGVYHLL